MSNSWQDIANSTLVVVWGANPAENHPACMAHINRARYPKDFFTGERANKKAATLVSIDPRKTRVSVQADLYVRIRPGTDIAFANGLMKYIDDTLRSGASTYSNGDPIPASVKSGYTSFLNQASNGTFIRDTGNAAAAAITIPTAGDAAALGNCAKYTDARFLVDATDSDYLRGRLSGTTWDDAATPSATTISDFPKKSTSIDTGNTVYKRLQAHLAQYPLATVAEICGCSVDEIQKVGDLFIQHSRHASTAETKTFTRKFKLGTAAAPTGAEGLWGYNVRSVSVTGYAASDVTVVAGASMMSLGSIARTAASTIPVGTVVTVTYTCETDQAPQAGFRSGTILYAMGITQHTCGSQNVKSFAVLQNLLGNMGRSGGGINALRGIHNVQGSTDMGLLYGNIPAYSGNPTVQPTAYPDATTNAFGKYMDGLWGVTLNNGGDYARAYTPAVHGLQQRGFFNMTLKWFGDYATQSAGGPALQASIDAAYSLWPKGNGDNHIQMFRKMLWPDTDNNRIRAAVVWGQNPAITEPNQTKVRAALEALDTLVCVDMFENETAAAKRKTGGVTYLLPSAAHAEKAGSSTNSGRTLQWRYEARKPAGNAKDDTELLLRFAKALDTAGAFSHITNVWNGTTIPGVTIANAGSVYTQLYANPYGYDGVGDYNAVAGSVELVTMRDLVSDAWVAPVPVAATGSEVVADKIYQETMSPLGSGGTLWIYTEAYDNSAAKTATTGVAGAAPRLTGEYTSWNMANRAKSRDRSDPYGNMGFHKWGYSWLVNRRCLYNNSEVAGDQNDFFMGPDSCSRLFAPKPLATGVTLRGSSVADANGFATLYPGVYNYSRWYRTILAPTSHVLADKPRLLFGATEAARRPPKHVEYNLAGRFPAHVEPYETPNATLAAQWGHNSTVTASTYNFGTGQNNASDKPNLVYGDTPVAGLGRTIAAGNPVDDPSRAGFPFILTTIRCVEHFQGGPITRNNQWNVELEPEPWIEINSVDARARGIKDGDYVNVITARGNSKASQEALTTGAAAGWAKGFVARVGTGLQSNQRVGVGVVAIPWHWGDRGLSTGSRANDLCIDAMDANTTIPESKACLCQIEKA